MFVYVIVNLETLKIYIGKTKRSNLEKYLKEKIWCAQKEQYRGRSYLFASMQKYSSTAWKIYPLFRGSSDEEICKQEKILIRALKTQHPDIGYNIANGGQTAPTGWHHSLETRAKLRILKLGKKLSPEHCQTLSLAHKGHPLSSSHKAAKAAAMGTPKTRLKLRESHLGHTISFETRAKMRDSHARRKALGLSRKSIKKT